jgi:cell shape-determining protein MreD
MIHVTSFIYNPGEHEAEKASNSYLMSLVALVAGLPLPIINLLATFFFFIANRKGTYFVRWHCTQALLSQFSLLLINSVGFWWTMSIIFSSDTLSNEYIAYIITVLFFNLTEFIATIYTAVNTRNKRHVQWFFYGRLTNLICKQ